MRSRSRCTAVLSIVIGLWGCGGGGNQSCPARPSSGPGVSRLNVGITPSRIAADGETVWVGGGTELVQIDARTRTIVGNSIPVQRPISGMAAAGGDLWITSGQEDGLLIRFDEESHEIVSQVQVGSGPGLVAVGEGAVWVLRQSAGVVVRVNPSTLGRPDGVTTLAVGQSPEDILVGEGAVWMDVQAEGLTRLDPTTGELEVRTQVSLENVGLGRVWVTGPWAPNGAVAALDPETMDIGGPVLGPLDITPVAVALTDDQVWVGKQFFYCELHNPVPEGPPIVSLAWFRIDPITLNPISFPTFVGGLTDQRPVFAGGTLWLPQAIGKSVVLIDIDEAGRGSARPTPGLPQPGRPTFPG